MKQQTKEWLEYRKNKIGSSDAAVIMGCSPWKTLYQLWQEKVGEEETPQIMTPSMQRGIDLEPMVREWYIKETGVLCFPKVVEHPGYEYVAASLDGISPDCKVIIEIKCPGRNVYEKAKMGIIPKHYQAQMQHQLACVPDAIRVDFVVYYEGDYHVVEVYPNEEYIAELMEKETDFWMNHVKAKVPPQEKNDHIDGSLDALQYQYQKQKAFVDWYKQAYQEENERLKKIEDEIFEIIGDKEVETDLYRYKTISRETIAYRQACIDAEINVEDYKKISTYHQIIPKK